MIIDDEIPRKQFLTEVDAVTPTAASKGPKEQTRRRARPWGGKRN
jgi:hypothetical protein